MTSKQLTDVPTEIEIGDALAACLELPTCQFTIRRLAFERDRYRDALNQIANHSVCCDARHVADNALSAVEVKT